MSTSTRSFLSLAFNSLKVALRNFKKFKLYSALNIGSLAIAFAAVVLIASYIYYQKSYDRWHANADSIYRATYHMTGQQDFDVHWARVPVDYVNELPNEIPEIKQLIRFQNQEQKYLKIGTETYKPRHAYVTDAAVFDVFDFPLKHGTKEKALSAPNSIVLTASLARQLFGHDNVVGEEISLVGDWTPDETVYQVTAVMEDVPSNTHLPVELFLSFSGPEARTGWAYVYTQLEEGASIESVQEKIGEFVGRHADPESDVAVTFDFQPLTDIYLTSNLAREIVPTGNLKNVRIFFIVGLLILIIALINFSNLSSALAMARAKEVGVRRILGARNFQLVSTSLAESIFSNLIAATFGATVGYLVFPFFQNLTGIEFNIPIGYFILGMGLLACITGILSGWYPAWIRLVGNSIEQLKSNYSFNLSAEGGWSLKRTLVTAQFAISILLVACALFGFQQFQFLSNKTLGINKDQVLAIPSVPDRITDSYTTFKDQVSKIAGVEGVSSCMEVPSREIRDMGPVTILGAKEESTEPPMMDIQIVEPDFPELMGMELVAGDWSKWKNWPESGPGLSESGMSAAEYLASRHRKYLINETAMKQLGWQEPEDAVGQQISWSNGPFELAYGVIQGVVKDFHQETLRNTIDPVVMTYEPIWLRTFLIKVNTSDVHNTIGNIEQVWSDLYPNYALEYNFLDDMYDQLYKNERVQINLMYILSALAVFIAFAGLFSLIAFSLYTRARELAIRKIVGANIWDVIKLMGRDYVPVFIISALIAVPLAFYGMENWLNDFAYRISLSPLVFIFSLVLLASLVGATIAWQVLRATRTNPMDILREQ